MLSGHDLSVEKLDPDDFLAAMIKSFQGNNGPLVDQILRLAS